MAREIGALDRGIGCAALLPGALIGLAGIADGAGLGGWRGLAELVGWAAICIALSLLVASRLARARAAGARLYLAALPAAAAAAALFALLPWHVGLAAPVAVKAAFVSILQAAGIVAVIAVAAAGFRLWRTQRRG